MAIIKSTQHQKVIGEFGEHLVSNMLSRSGLEVSIVDYTGIDLVAFDTTRNEQLGITMKSRTRTKGTENDPVNILRNNDRMKLLNACRFFGYIPWIAVFVERLNGADIYLTSLENYDKRYMLPESKVQMWRMSKKMREQYEDDPEVMHIEISLKTNRWW